MNFSSQNAIEAVLTTGTSLMLTLSSQKPFAEGGRRLCFQHPELDQRCVKVRRPDKPLEYLRSRRSFPKNLMPLHTFDDSLEEFRIMKQLDAKYGNVLYDHVSRCEGFVDTDMGEGLVCELIKDADGEVSLTLRQFIEKHGYSPECEKIVDVFAKFWRQHALPYRGNFRLENLVVQRGKEGQLLRLVVIDDIGYSSSIPQWLMPKSLSASKAAKKVDILYQRIQLLITKVSSLNT